MKLLIVDIDDTLFDWLTMWSASFEEFSTALASTSRLSKAELVAALRRLHIGARTSERGFSRQDAEELGASPEDIERLAHAFEDATLGRTRLFPDVPDTLEELRRRGVTIVAHTDTPASIAADRFVELGLDGVVDALFATAGTGVTIHRRQARRPLLARVTELPHPKPDPKALQQVLADCGAEAREAVYVGDSKMKDLAMARAAGVVDVYAAYGCRRSSSAYDLLKSVSHWTDEEIARERAVLAEEPTHSLDQFQDVLRFA
jgi:phosphoglycolate phosphatase